MENKIIKSTNYNVYCGGSIFKDLEALLNQDHFLGVSYFILVDENTKNYCLPILLEHLPSLSSATIIEINCGEEYKHIETCNQIWSEMIRAEADRKVLFINLGGGVIGDMGGFVASTYKRGVRFINIPTTLLSQVDASVGGKLGIDFNGLKNIIGVFKDPEGVFVYPGFMNTLSDRLILSGFAEIIKHALIYDKSYWKEVKSIPLSTGEHWTPIIAKSISIKNKVVKADPFESGLRKILNFGHTIGHAIESQSFEQDGEPLLHGEAIAIGMICETYLSYKKCGLSNEDLDDICSFIFSKYPIRELDESEYHRLIELMRNDKKNRGNEINFSLLSAIGKCEFDISVGVDLIIDALNFYKEQINIQSIR